MASLHAFVPAQDQAAFLNVSIHQQHRLHGLNQSKVKHKWTYLLANTIAFSDKQQQAIRVSKPHDSMLMQYLEKIITGGQCSTLFVEQMDLDEMSTLRVKQLCAIHHVGLVNLLVSDLGTKGKLVRGPW
jgi:hypothetical protein